MPLSQVNSVDMDRRLLRSFFAHFSTFKDAIRTPVEYVPTYATFFGGNDRPATLFLLLTWLLLLYGLLAYKGPLARRKAKATLTIRCLLALIALSVSINLPMSDMDGSTIRCYTMILVLLAQMHLYGRTSGVKVRAMTLHMLVGIQIAALPGLWSKFEGSPQENGMGKFFVCFWVFWWFSMGSVVAISPKDNRHEDKLNAVRKKADEEKAAKREALKKEAAAKKAAEKEAAKKEARKKQAAKEQVGEEVAAKGYVTIEESDKMDGAKINAVTEAVKDEERSEEEYKVASGSKQPLRIPFKNPDNYVFEEIEMVDRRPNQASLDQMQAKGDESLSKSGKTRAVDDVCIDMDMAEEMSDGFTAVESEHETEAGEKQHQDKKEEVSESDETSTVAHNEQQGSQSSVERGTTTEVIAVQPEKVLKEKCDEPVYEYGLTIGFFILCFLDCLVFTLLQFY